MEICFFQKRKKKKKKEKDKKKTKEKREISFKKKKKSFFSKSSYFELRLDLILYERGTQAVFQRPGPSHPNNLGEQIHNNVTKLLGCMLG